MMLELRAQNIPARITLTYAFAGASGRKGDRNGDIGCEKQPITQFFQVRPEECKDNAVHHRSPHLQTPQPGRRSCSSPSLRQSQLAIADFSKWSTPPSAIREHHTKPTAPHPHRLHATHQQSAALHQHPTHNSAGTRHQPRSAQPPSPHAAARSKPSPTAVILNTPDSYMNPVGGALTIAAEGLWDPKSGVRHARLRRLALDTRRLARPLLARRARPPRPRKTTLPPLAEKAKYLAHHHIIPRHRPRRSQILPRPQRVAAPLQR